MRLHIRDDPIDAHRTSLEGNAPKITHPGYRPYYFPFPTWFRHSCFFFFLFSVADNQVTTQNLKLTPEGPFPVYDVDLRKLSGSGMCYIQAGGIYCGDEGIRNTVHASHPTNIWSNLTWRLSCKRPLYGITDSAAACPYASTHLVVLMKALVQTVLDGQ